MVLKALPPHTRAKATANMPIAIKIFFIYGVFKQVRYQLWAPKALGEKGMPRPGEGRCWSERSIRPGDAWIRRVPGATTGAWRPWRRCRGGIWAGERW